MSRRCKVGRRGEPGVGAGTGTLTVGKKQLTIVLDYADTAVPPNSVTATIVGDRLFSKGSGKGKGNQ